MFSKEKNVQIVVSLLKQNNINQIIISPGATNVSFVVAVQDDPFFHIYSAYDERSAAYMACGLASVSKQPVVLSCTGATASREYLPGLTEAYYQHLPIIAITSMQHFGKAQNCIPQAIDRSRQFVVLVQKSVQLYKITSKDDEIFAEDECNKALILSTHGPVHINLSTDYNNSFSDEEIPSARKITLYSKNDTIPSFDRKRIAVFIGAHNPFDKKTEKLIDTFCFENNAIALCDHTSNFNGKFKVLANIIFDQEREYDIERFDLVIHIGYVSGAYLKFKSKEVWRVNPDGKIINTFGQLTSVFAMEEAVFFEKAIRNSTGSYDILNYCNHLLSKMITHKIDIPFSNIWIAKVLSQSIRENTVLHFGILNSLRAWNYFECAENVYCYSNTGGFGIDGCVSSLLGAASANPNKRYICIVGDLAFFYDINSLLNTNIPHNFCIVVINNGLGTEFKNYSHRAYRFGEKTNSYIAAAGHNGKKNKNLVKNYAKTIGISYFSAENKDEFIENYSRIVTDDTPLIFEVFTNDEDESKALKIIRCMDKETTKEQVAKLFKKLFAKLRRNLWC